MSTLGLRGRGLRRHVPRPATVGVVIACLASAASVGVTYSITVLPATIALVTAWLVGTVSGRAVGGGGRAAGTAAVLPPILAAPAFMPLLDLTQILILGIAALGLNVVVGWTGQLSLAQGTIVGLGAYVSAILTVDLGWPLLVTIPCAAAFCGLVGLLLGSLALRFDGVFLAVLTLSFALITPIVLKYFDGLTGGSQGLVLPSTDLPGSPATGKYAVTLLCAAVVITLTRNVVHGGIGLAFHAVRESLVAAEGSGIDPSRTKIGAFVIGSSLAGVAGSLYAMTVGFVSPDSFGPFYGIQFLTMVVVGGVRSISGAFFGAWLIFQLNNHVQPIEIAALVGTDALSLPPQAVFALVLIGVLVVAPHGMAGLFTDTANRLLRRTVQRRPAS